MFLWMTVSNMRDSIDTVQVLQARVIVHELSAGPRDDEFARLHYLELALAPYDSQLIKYFFQIDKNGENKTLIQKYLLLPN